MLFRRTNRFGFNLITHSDNHIRERGYHRHRYSYWTVQRDTPAGNNVMIPGGHSITSTGHGKIIGKSDTYYRDNGYRRTLPFPEIMQKMYPQDIINDIHNLHENRNKDQKRLRFGATIIESIISFNDFLLSGSNLDKSSIDWVYSHEINAALCMQHVLESKLPVSNYMNRSKEEKEEFLKLSKREQDRIKKEGSIQIDIFDNGSNVKTYRCSESRFKIPYLYAGIPIRRKGIISRFMSAYMHRDKKINRIYNDVIKEINEYAIQLLSHVKVDDKIAGENKTPNDILKEIFGIDYFHEYYHLIDGVRSSKTMNKQEVDEGVSIQGCMSLNNAQDINALILKFFLADLKLNFDQLKIFKRICEEVSKFVEANIINTNKSTSIVNSNSKLPIGVYNLTTLGVDPSLLDFTNGGTEIHIAPMQNLLDSDNYTFIIKQRFGYDMSHDAVSYAYGNDLKKHKYSTVSKCYNVARGWYSFWWGGICCGIGSNGSSKHKKRCGHTSSWNVYGYTTAKQICNDRKSINSDMALDEFIEGYKEMLKSEKHQAKLTVEFNHAVPVYSSTSLVKVNKKLFEQGKIDESIVLHNESILESSNDIFKPFVFNNRTNEFCRYPNFQKLDQEELLSIVGRDFEIGTETIDKCISQIEKFERLLKG